MEERFIPENFVITGSARREPSPDEWKESLANPGDYPEDFLWHLDYVSSDLSLPETLRHFQTT